MQLLTVWNEVKWQWVAKHLVPSSDYNHFCSDCLVSKLVGELVERRSLDQQHVLM